MDSAIRNPTIGKALMVQGTASHVGKSVLVAGLCRLFRRDGLRVAPFKAQNMALNSFVTPEGGEIGRAQAAQAEAAGVPPSVAMNPILLKPEGNARSQVVVEGKVYGTMDAAEYHRRTGELWPVVESSLSGLLQEFDLVIIEGAGSPAELNLRAHDIVNMRVAKLVSAPVALVADIDRGGVFAALVGTMELLEPEERALVAGFVVNKFRGDPTLFHPGIAFLEDRLGRPSLGLIPWIEALGVPEEDSLGLPRQSSSTRRQAAIDVVVVRLPHVANFDDFDPLGGRPGVAVRYVDRVGDFGQPDLVILPGTKTTRADLAFLQDRGLDRAIIAAAGRGTATLGICGGYQMLGARIDDPDGVEGPPGSAAGLGLLPTITRYAAAKTTRQVQARVEASHGLFAAARGSLFEAYEIHMGQTEGSSSAVFAVKEPDGKLRPDGAASPDGRIFGTYLHGLFRNPVLLGAALDQLAQRKGITLAGAPVPEDPYDRLAAILRSSIDLPRLREIAGIDANRAQ